MIQIVTVKWGDRYSAAVVNGMAREIKKWATEPVKFVCLTDDVQENFDDDIKAIPFPDIDLPMNVLMRGCCLKLSMFHPGVLDPKEVAIFFDLDTAIIGDVSLLAQHVRRKPGLHILENHWIRHWRVRKLVRAISPETYYFGNSSAVGFIPEEMDGTLEAFVEGQKRILSGAETSPKIFKAHVADERFMSYHNWDTVRTWPNRLVCKFPVEYLGFSLLHSVLKDKMPWIKRRRNKQVAVTFLGDVLKPNLMADMKVGEVLRYKYYVRRWKQVQFSAYWKRILSADK